MTARAEIEAAGGGVFDMSAEEYHADPCPEPSLSSSLIKIMDKGTMAHAWEAHPRLNPDYEPQEGKREFDLGSAVHALLLEGGTGIEVLYPEDYPAKNGNIPKGYTNDAIREARDAVYERGGVPLLPSQWEDVQKMAVAVHRQMEGHEELAGWLSPERGKSEQVLIWQEDCGIWCRARLDRLMNDRNAIDGDLKTTGTTANPEVLGRFAADQGWDIQDAFYRRGLQALGLRERPRFRFVCVEAYKPFCMSVLGIPPDVQAIADMKVERAIQQWSHSLKTGEWPGYPKRTCFIEFPEWQKVRFQERCAREAMLTQLA